MLVEKIERAREIMRSKIDPNNTQPQAELTDEIEVMVRKAQSKWNLRRYSRKRTL